MSRQVLIVKTSSLGDVVHALPAAAEASAHGYVLDWVVEEAFADLPRLLPGVRHVIPVAWRRWRRQLRASAGEMKTFRDQIQAVDYDLVLDSQGLLKSAAIALCARGPRAGYSHTSAREPWAAFAYQQRHRILRGQHAIDRQRQLFAAALGYPLAAQPVWVASQTAPVAEQATTDQILLMHGTTWATKHWPEPMWIALAQMIRQQGYRPCVTWGDETERARAQNIATASGAEVLDKMPIQQLVQVLLQSRLVIGVDSGLVHLSAGLGIPTLALYGPTDARLTGARGPRAYSVSADLPCAPCVRPQCTAYRGDPLIWQAQPVEPPCFAASTPALVWQRAQQLLGSPAESA
ncbi:MAG: lipopolysaccharide heptosyltransferase I [Pseudomonadota bacterium]